MSLKMQETDKPFLPKNVRQIGIMDAEYKVYMEDYVITFLQQLASIEETGSRVLLLFGESKEYEGLQYTYIYGAALSKKRRLEEGELLFDFEEKSELFETKDSYFPKCQVVGWCVIENQFNMISKDTAWRDMGEGLYREGKVYFKINLEEERQELYLYQNGMPRLVKGYQIFYDTNKDMQNYLVSWNQQKKLPPAERVLQDSAIKEFRNTIHRKKEARNESKYMHYMYGITCGLMVVLCVMGITMMNNYDKLKKMEVAILHLTESMEERSVQVQSNEVMVVEEAIKEKQELQTQLESEPETQLKTQPETQPEPQPQPELETQSEQEAVVDEMQQEVQQEEPNIVQEVSNQPQVYIVEKGDTLAKISIKFYQNNSKVEEMCVLNQINEPNKIMVGQKIILP